MTCASCGATIAEKAIVCYRCGAPTAQPRPREAGPRPSSPIWPAVLVLVMFVALLGWFGWTLPPGSVERRVAIGGLIAALAGLMWRLARRRR